MLEFSEADIAGWTARVEPVWAAFEAGERDVDTLCTMLDPDPEARAELIDVLWQAAITGDEEAMYVFGRMAIAGLHDEVTPDLGWHLIELAAQNWASAQLLLKRRDEFPKTD